MSDIRHLAQRVLDLDAQATPGPWRDTFDHQPGYHIASVGSCVVTPPDDVVPGRSSRDDAALIAEYRTAAPALASRVIDLEAQVEALTDERDDLKAQRDAMRADVPVDEQLLGHLAMTGIAKSHDAYKAQKRAEAERDEALSKLAEANARADAAETLLAGAREDRASAEAIASARHETISALRADLARMTLAGDDLRRALMALVTLAIDLFGYGDVPMDEATRKSVPLAGKHLHDFLYAKAGEMTAQPSAPSRRWNMQPTPPEVPSERPSEPVRRGNRARRNPARRADHRSRRG